MTTAATQAGASLRSESIEHEKGDFALAAGREFVGRAHAADVQELAQLIELKENAPNDRSLCRHEKERCPELK